MNPHLIRRLFKNPSASLLAANAHDYGNSDPDRPTQSPVPQPPVRNRPVGEKEGEGGDPTRVSVRIASYRRRLIDPDNLVPKYFVDACRYAGLIKDDTAEEIEFSVRQEKVATKEEERTEITITRPALLAEIRKGEG